MAANTIARFKLKEEFIANAIHRLRTPLAIIKGNVDLTLREKKLPPLIRRVFRSINTEIKDLSTLLSDITFLIRKDADFARPMIFKKLSLGEVIRRVVGRLAPLYLEKNIRVKLGKNPKIFVQGDKIYLEKVFNNLIGNAVKYTRPGGKVAINYTKKDSRVEVRIKDSGIGIPKKDLPHIFDRFYRVKKIRTVSDVGTGLGLPISRGIAEAHGGKLEAESTLGRGSTFIVTLPLLRARLSA